MTLPDLVNEKAPLPDVYKEAKNALSLCMDIDECKDWADKAMAIASYAKQADDMSLMKLAMRIKARATLRCGELLREIEPKHTGRPSINRDGDDPILTRKQAAEDAGLSERQRKQAIRIAKIPKQEFEEAIESDDPPSITELAEMGIKRRPLTAEDFSAPSIRELIWKMDEVSNHVKHSDVLGPSDPAIYSGRRASLEPGGWHGVTSD